MHQILPKHSEYVSPVIWFLNLKMMKQVMTRNRLLQMSEVLSSGDGQFSLPPHYRCASYTINLISTSDVDKHLNSCADTKAINRSSIAKCTALWTKVSRSTLASEQVEEVSRRKLMVPTSVRWNSLYEAISRIITIPMNEMKPLCVKLGIKCLNEREYLFLQEY